jgi:TadE-like protein
MAHWSTHGRAAGVVERGARPTPQRSAGRLPRSFVANMIPGGRAGQAAVEMALVLPVLAVLLVGVVDLARVFFVSIGVSNAARAGVAYGAQSLTTAKDNSGMKQAALDDGSGISGLSATAKEFCECVVAGVHLSCSPTPICGKPHTYVQVQTSAQFQTLLHYPGLPSTVELSGNAVMRVQ